MRIRNFIAVILACVAIPAFAGEIGAQWTLESSEAIVGQSLTLTLELEGTDSFDPPNFSVPGVEISFQGGSPRNSTSIVWVNGKTTKTVRKSWVGSWELKCAQEGSYHIVAQTWNVAGSTISLPALDWRVTAARTDNRFILKQSLNPTTCVSGVELEYTLVWYIGQSVQNPEFTLPILDNPDLAPVESSLSSGAGSGDVFQIQYKGRVITGAKSIETMGGKQYTALTIKFRVKPAKPGRYDLSPTMVSFDGAVDTRQEQDFFGNIVNEPVYRTLVSRANPLVLSVKDLPAAGKPNPFSGLIGKLALSWDAVQGAYSVGEPIRLTLSLSGVLNKPNLDLDHMVTTALSGSDFQVTSDLSAKDEDGKRSFIFRARHPGKLVIPPLTLNYYDPTADRYGVTATQALTFTISGSAANTSPASGIAGSSASGPQSPAAQTSGASAGSSATAPTSASSRDSRLALMNPNGLRRPLFPAIPWWCFVLPGLVPALVLSLLALWRHSLRRRIAVQRKAWRADLAPLAAANAANASLTAAAATVGASATTANAANASSTVSSATTETARASSTAASVTATKASPAANALASVSSSGVSPGRAALAEGRERLQRLLLAGPDWRARLESDGRWASLMERVAEWDEAFFDDDRDGEPWLARWDEAARTMEAWK
jgi:hypothetical protein